MAAVGLGGALTPLVTAFILAYLLYPLINILEKRGVGRNVAATAVLILVMLALTYLMIHAVPLLVAQGKELVARFPDMLARTLARIEAIARHYGYTLQLDRSGIVELVRQSLSGVGLKQVLNVTRMLSGAFSGVLHSLLAIINLFLFPVFFFFVINRYEEIRMEIQRLIPASKRQSVAEFSAQADAVLSGFIRGQLMVALILAVLYCIGFSIVGVPFALFVGLATGLLSIIPYVGATLGFLTSLALVLAIAPDLTAVLGLVSIFAVIQGLEGLVITPRIVGDKVGLGTLETMLALIIGGNLFGFTGMLMAIPMAGILRLLYLRARETCIEAEPAG